MLADADVIVTLAVDDLAAAKEFYEGTLGLAAKTSDEGGVLYKSGNGKVYVYESEYAGTNKATAAGWSVKDFDGTVKELADKGVTFEHYPDMPGVTMEGDVHVMEGDVRAVWFKDPAGNILAIDNYMHTES